MDWIKVSIKTTNEYVESIVNILLSHGVNGVQIFDNHDLQQILSDNPLSWDYVDESLVVKDRESIIEFYVSPESHGREMLNQIKIGLYHLSPSFTSTIVNDESWLHEWKKHFKPIRLGHRIVIVPAWETYHANKDDIVFNIDPGSVFGTGQHQTTQLCVEALEEYVFPGCSILDIGCGSGILSIIGLLLGAKNVLACDIDPAALTSFNENAERNKIDTGLFHIHIGDIFSDNALHSHIISNPLNLIVANIVADPIIRLAPLIHNYLTPSGFFIASGIIAERIDDVRYAVTQHMKFINTIERDGWFAVIGQLHA